MDRWLGFTIESINRTPPTIGEMLTPGILIVLSNDAGAHAHSRSTLEVPIFWFIDGDTLLIDKHYQAKALSDMVIIAQSEPSSWESHLQCNGDSLLWDLR